MRIYLSKNSKGETVVAIIRTKQDKFKEINDPEATNEAANMLLDAFELLRPKIGLEGKK